VVFEKHNTQLVKPMTFMKLVSISSCTNLLSDLQATHEIYMWESLNIPIKTIELKGTRDLRGPPSVV
jgi:hypothetical protein